MTFFGFRSDWEKNVRPNCSIVVQLSSESVFSFLLFYSRVSEEKEESVQRLRDEQETFERKIQQLEQQNLFIVQERESILNH